MQQHAGSPTQPRNQWHTRHVSTSAWEWLINKTGRREIRVWFLDITVDKLVKTETPKMMTKTGLLCCSPLNTRDQQFGTPAKRSPYTQSREDWAALADPRPGLEHQTPAPDPLSTLKKSTWAHLWPEKAIGEDFLASQVEEGDDRRRNYVKKPVWSFGLGDCPKVRAVFLGERQNCAWNDELLGCGSQQALVWTPGAERDCERRRNSRLVGLDTREQRQSAWTEVHSECLRSCPLVSFCMVNWIWNLLDCVFRARGQICEGKRGQLCTAVWRPFFKQWEEKDSELDEELQARKTMTNLHCTSNKCLQHGRVRVKNCFESENNLQGCIPEWSWNVMSHSWLAANLRNTLQNGRNLSWKLYRCSGIGRFLKSLVFS